MMESEDIKVQTGWIVKCLFDEEGEVQDRNLIESDSPGDDPFDPVIIAEKLRELGDKYEESVIQPLLKKLQETPENQVATVFNEGVDCLCQTLSYQGLAPEVLLLRAAVMLGMGVKRKLPSLVGTVESAMVNLLNRRLVTWIQQQGGWDRVASDE
ncbi:bcl-2-like protein 15 [Paramormyrops kingsleyae]|uniref:bcl-2-like protein 15 n=1 Tax=Paramormyrops kingsleyae TaxID=1676925 RepID=UPI003B96E6C3